MTDIEQRTVANTAWKRVVTPGQFHADWWHDGRRGIRLFVEIEYRFEMNQKWELSITGVEGPKRNGDCVGSCGQITVSSKRLAYDHFFYAAGWDGTMLLKLADIWDRWHLNGMRAGSPRQQAWLRDHPVTAVYPESYYDKAKAALREAGLEPDTEFFHPTRSRDRVIASGVGADSRINRYPVFDVPYSYGSAWIYEAVPADVLQWLYDLPTAEWTHPWGRHGSDDL